MNRTSVVVTNPSTLRRPLRNPSPILTPRKEAFVSLKKWYSDDTYRQSGDAEQNPLRAFT